MLLSQLLSTKKIKDLEVELTEYLGNMTLKVTSVIFHDGTKLQIECDYGANCFLTDSPNSSFLDQQIKRFLQVKEVSDKKQIKIIGKAYLIKYLKPSSNIESVYKLDPPYSYKGNLLSYVLIRSTQWISDWEVGIVACDHEGKPVEDYEDILYLENAMSHEFALEQLGYELEETIA